MHQILCTGSSHFRFSIAAVLHNRLLSTFPRLFQLSLIQYSNSSLADDFVQPAAFVLLHPPKKRHSCRNISCAFASTDTALGAPGVSVFPVRKNMETGVEPVILQWSDHVLPTSITSNLKLKSMSLVLCI